MMDLHPGDRVGLIACSNGVSPAGRRQMEQLSAVLEELGLECVLSSCLYQGESAYSGTDRQRARALEALYLDGSIRAIFDVSGGDLANGVLSYLDFDVISQHPKPFFGYSDLTTILNAVYTKTGIPGGLYSIRSLIREDAQRQQQAFKALLVGDEEPFTGFSCRFVQGEAMEGTVVGGNIRCLLKLAGTPFFPPLEGNILLLESLGGGLPQMAALLTQLRQMGAFRKVSGLLLGTFTRYQESESVPIEALVQSIVDDPALPIAKTEEVGHGADARCVWIGKPLAVRSC